MFNCVLNTPLFTYSYIQIPYKFTIIVLIADSTLKQIRSTRSEIVENVIFGLEYVTQCGLILRY